jgi:uncharacterized protein (TIGR02453 family)
MAGNPYVTPALFAFLNELKENNERDWFNANKARYEADVREPMLAFIRDFAPRLARLSPHMRADARKTGGSLFRIFRDTRFSADKSPYKTAVGVQFRHGDAESAHAPCFYLNLEPGRVFVGAGIWRPDSSGQAAIRDAIVRDGQGWQRALGAKDFSRTFQLSGDSLKRPPRGFDADHPLVEDLKRKDFIAVSDKSEAWACGADFLEDFTAHCRQAVPFMKFVTGAVGMGW